MLLRKVGYVHGLQVPSIVIDSTSSREEMSIVFHPFRLSNSPRNLVKTCTLSANFSAQTSHNSGVHTEVPQSKYARELQCCVEVIV